MTSPALPASTLMLRRSQLTVLTTTDGPKLNGRYDGLTIEVSIETGTKLLLLDGVHFSCGADTTTDTAADRFDNS